MSTADHQVRACRAQFGLECAAMSGGQCRPVMPSARSWYCRATLLLEH